MVFIQKPYYLLLLAGFLFLFLFFYTDRDTIILLDEYNLPSKAISNYIRLLAVGNILLWAIYVVATNKLLSNKLLLWIHVVVTLVSSVILVSYFKFSLIKGLPSRFLKMSNESFPLELIKSDSSVIFTVVLLIAAQLVLIIHLILGLIKYISKRKISLGNFSKN